MRSAAFVFVALVLAVGACAEGWKIETDANLTLNQSSYSASWVGEETGSITWATSSNTLIEKSLVHRIHLRNNLKLAFGQTHTQDKETGHWHRPVKSTDLVDLESTLRFAEGSPLEPTLAVRVITQFLDAGPTGRRSYFNPLTITETAGVVRVFFKAEDREFLTRVAAGLRQRVDRNHLNPDTGARETEVVEDGGFELVGDLKIPLLAEKIELVSKLTLFQAVRSSRASEPEETERAGYWKAPDVNWETSITVHVSKYVMVSLYTQLLYDKEIHRAGRFKETLALGLNFELL